MSGLLGKTPWHYDRISGVVEDADGKSMAVVCSHKEIGGIERGYFIAAAPETQAELTKLQSARCDEYDALKSQNAELAAVLQRYMNAYPAFRIKPEGAPGSHARNEQERLMALEEAANTALSRARGGK